LLPQFTVPLLLDTVTRRIVCNESELIMRDFNCAFDAFARFPSVNLRPPHLADAIDKLNHAMCAIWFPCICSAVVAVPVLL
jgi:glutathionyl-hydroquinone reductase